MCGQSGHGGDKEEHKYFSSSCQLSITSVLQKLVKVALKCKEFVKTDTVYRVTGLLRLLTASLCKMKDNQPGFRGEGGNCSQTSV